MNLEECGDMSVRDLLRDRQASMFVGRTKEIAKLRQFYDDEEWRLLHIHGIGGMGKSALLRTFADMVNGQRCYYFSRQDLRTPDKFIFNVRNRIIDSQETWFSLNSDDGAKQTAEICIRTVTQQLNEYAINQRSIVILLDDFDPWGNVELWLRDEWLSHLSPSVKICTSGRYALEERWLRGEWHWLVEQLELQPLSMSEIESYAINCGISHHSTIISLHHFSMGVPLALTMACQILMDNQTLNAVQQKQLSGYLAAQVTNDIVHPSLRKYIEAASLVLKFDQDLLHSLLQEEIDVGEFRQLCRLPFVLAHQDGWMLHDCVKKWISADFNFRLPHTAFQYQQRALQDLFEREQVKNRPSNVPDSFGSKPSMDDTVKLVQNALKYYAVLPLKPEITNTFRNVLPEVNADMHTDVIASILQTKLLSILQSFSSGSREEQRFFQILQHAYIKKIGTHEVVAENLNLSISSYYRYLRNAVWRTTCEIVL